MYKLAVNALSSFSAKGHTAYSSRIPQHVRHWRDLLLSAERGRFHNRSLQAWSCGKKSDTLPSFRMLDSVPTYRSGLFFDMFAGWSRHYSVQPLKHTMKTEPGNNRDISEPSADAKPSDSVTDISIRAESYSSDSTAALSEQQHSDTATGVQQQSLVDSNEVVSQIDTSEKLGLMQRFRMMYKQYGAVLVSVHTATSAVWISMFYCATVSGVDILPLLRWLGASDTVISPFLVPGVGKAAIIYLMYKLASPARYAVTIAGTQLAVRLLRRRGYLKVPETRGGKPDSLRSIVSDGRAKVKDRVEELRDDMQELKGRVGQMHGQLSSQRSLSRQGKL